ncbi:MAG: hypothetical protein RLZZ40_431 [Actinomycetota bacterium]
MKKFVSIVAATVLALAGASAATSLPADTHVTDAGLQNVGEYFGKISWSIDGASEAGHVAGDEIAIQVDKPEGATVRAALFVSGDGGNRNSNSHTPQDMYLNDQNIVFTHWASLTAGDQFQTYFGDVTDIVKDTIDAHPAGVFDLNFDQGDGTDGDSSEGGSLIVIFDDPNAPLSSIYLNAGTSNPEGDSFTFTFPALTAENLSNDILLSIGSSNSYEWGWWSQTSEIKANGDYLSTIAGGCDDSTQYIDGLECGFGGYNTIGGIGNTAGAPGYVDTEVTSYDVNLDGELYLLNSFLTEGDTSLEVTTRNYSSNDNLYFAGIYLVGVLPSETYCDDNPVDCGLPTETAQTGAQGVPFITLLGGGLLVAGIAIAVYRIVSRRKGKPTDDNTAE